MIDGWTVPQHPTLGEYRALVEVADCWCGTPFPQEVQAYDHHYGWPVRGYARLQWLYITCSKCGDEWALWKLGVSHSNVADPLT